MKTTVLWVTLAVVGLISTTTAASPDTPTTRSPIVVIIVDDIGNHLHIGIRVLRLPGKLNIGVLPHTPNSEILAKMAPAAGKEVILHAPMSNASHRRLGLGALTSDMPEQHFRETLSRSIASTPHVRGVSNHMGSELTSQREPMQWLMQTLAEQNLYFIDSRTSANTVAAEIASEFQVPHLSRRVFLDNEQNTPYIDHQFQELLEHATDEGIAVAICHPYDVTLDYLEKAIPKLQEQGFQLALVSEVLAEQSASNRLD